MRLISYMAPGFPHSLFRCVGDIIGAEVSFVETSSGPLPGEDPFASGEADLGWICSTSFVNLALSATRPSVKLAGVAWVPDDPTSSGEPVYFGDLVVRPGSTVDGLEALRGARIGCNDVTSLSGHYALRFAVDDLGEDPNEFAELVFTGAHRQSLVDVVEGRLDAAVVDSVVRINSSLDDAEVDRLRVVQRLGPWPVQPLVARADLDAGVVAEIADRLLAHADDPTLQAELRAASLAGLTRVGAGHYDSVKAAMDRTHA